MKVGNSSLRRSFRLPRCSQCDRAGFRSTAATTVDLGLPVVMVSLLDVVFLHETRGGLHETRAGAA